MSGWAKGIPAVPGWYWIRYGRLPGVPPEVVEVFEVFGGGCHGRHGMRWREGDGASYGDAADYREPEFLGPLEPPA